MLRHILTNKEGMKVGVIVNDVAEINIDAKLIRNQVPRSAPARAEGCQSPEDAPRHSAPAACAPARFPR